MILMSKGSTRIEEVNATLHYGERVCVILGLASGFLGFVFSDRRILGVIFFALAACLLFAAAVFGFCCKNGSLRLGAASAGLFRWIIESIPVALVIICWVWLWIASRFGWLVTQTEIRLATVVLTASIVAEILYHRRIYSK